MSFRCLFIVFAFVCNCRFIVFAEMGETGSGVFLECGLLGNYQEHWRERQLPLRWQNTHKISPRLLPKVRQYNPPSALTSHVSTDLGWLVSIVYYLA